MTFFGQFFDHGLDLITKGGNGTVYIPLMTGDPLIAGDDRILGNADDLPVAQRFMALTRSTPVADPVTGALTETKNTTTSWIDQNQTYTSHASHQVFLREYERVGNVTAATGHLLDGATGGIATWAETKAHALEMLGIRLTDADIFNVPLLRTDAFGKFIPDPVTGYAQIATPTGFVVGSAAGTLVPANAFRTGHAFLDDIAHSAVPVFQTVTVDGVTTRVLDADGLPILVADAGTAVGNAVSVDTRGRNTEYDNELLDQHFITGDGRGNENIGLTAVYTIFHSEHNRLVEANKLTLIEAARTGNLALLNEYLSTDVTAVTATTVPVDLLWDGERLFQAAKLVTEMQYQHLVFEEFARKVQPMVDPFIFTNTPDIDPSIVAEFAHTVYRFGHSMLTDTVARMDANMQSDDVSLFQAFLNPAMFNASGVDAAHAAGAIVRGMTRQAGNEIDEFVVEALRNQLVGLPLDLAALNIARGRETGVPSFNDFRAQLYAETGQVQLKPYVSWLDYAENLKNPLSIINFIAAYGTHETITAEATVAGKRDAATLLVFGDNTAAFDTERFAFLNHNGSWANRETGLNDVDFWIGGLAEAKMEFGGMLGSTFNFVFETQMEKLQNGDRMYYLSRLQGTNLLNQLEPNTFSGLVMRNTDLGEAGSSHLAGNLFDTPDLILEVDRTRELPGQVDPEQPSAILQMLNPKVVRGIGTVDNNDDGIVDFRDGGYIKFFGGEHVVLGGTEGNDTLIGDKGIDTLWGDGGNDYLNARSEADQVFGGDGDDVIEDPFGDDLLRGENGDDVISGGAGFDILFGGAGQDFIVVGAETGEVFAGEGNDFVLGGGAPDVLMGNEGDDWLEGGDGLDGLAGENSELFFNSPIIGHDVLNGQGNDTDYDGESGDDIMVQGPGIQRNNGMLGFDWAIHKGDPNGADSDLGVPIFPTQQALTLRDRFDSVEGLSGWKFNDILTGTNLPTGAVGGPVGGGVGIIGAPELDSRLTQEGVDRISGLQAVIGDTLPPAPVGYVFDPSLGGDILLGGGGSDTFWGKAGNDIIDGDSWLNVRIAVHATKDHTSPVLFSVDGLGEIKARMLSREINPGQLAIVREILDGDVDNTAIDRAIYTGDRAEYDISRNTDGSVTVNHARPVLVGNEFADGIDMLRNIEEAQFADQLVSLINQVATGIPTISDTSPTETRTITASLAGIADANGLPPAAGFHYQWQSLTGAAWLNVGADSASFTPIQAQVNRELRVVVSFTDNGGTVEQVTSAPTIVVGDFFSGDGNANSVTLTVGDDFALGEGGNDSLNGGNGNDNLLGGAGNDSLLGGAGADIMNGGIGDDTMAGDGGNDVYAVNSTLDVLIEVVGGGAGDRVNTTLSSFTLGANFEILTFVGTGAATGTGNAGGNTIVGNIGNDMLDGGGGNDSLFGGDGNDRLTGGTGNDLLNGGAGSNVLVFGVGFGADRVVGFDANPAGGQDLLLLSGLGVTAANFAAQVGIAQVGINTVVSVGGNTITLLTMTAANVNASDFLFA